MKIVHLSSLNHNLESAAYVKLETLYDGQSMEQHRRKLKPFQ
ncbi:hypothetical protein TYRP_015352 [Tyrophagus putrescentiae]|nr:hypothetical protein TYRP_015352 [Tyrophagus putrescentiae]